MIIIARAGAWNNRRKRTSVGNTIANSDQRETRYKFKHDPWSKWQNRDVHGSRGTLQACKSGSPMQHRKKHLQQIMEGTSGTFLVSSIFKRRGGLRVLLLQILPGASEQNG